MPRRPQSDTIAAPFVGPAPETRWRDRLWIALIYAVAFVALGSVVSGKGPTVFTGFDYLAKPYAGIGLFAATILTQFGTFPVYTTISALLLLLGVFQRQYLRAVLVSIVTLLVAWQVSDACKVIFHRPRPNYWHVFHETSLSYPSGHATLVIAFYGFWTSVAWASTMPVAAKRWIRLAFAALAIAIGWARLALGAHWLTDVLGGYLLGAALASLAMIVYRAVGPTD